MIRILNLIIGRIIFVFGLIFFKFHCSSQNQLHYIKRNIFLTGSAICTHPKELIDIIVKMEDRRYYDHVGIDFIGILRAIYRNLSKNRLEGASTIVQQLVRNLTNERRISLNRKLKEIIFAVHIDFVFTKDEILNCYLNSYPFHRVKGIENLCSVENWDLLNLNQFEIAQLTARIKYPCLSSNNLIRFLKRVRTIEIIQHNSI